MKKYYHTLTKDEKKKINSIYKNEYKNSEVKTRLTRLVIYGTTGYLTAIILIIYSLKIEDGRFGNIFIACLLIIASTIFLIGRYLIKLKVLNKIALKNK